MEQIAVIRLAPGQVGYYDELSRIHLTIGNPERSVYAGTNCSQLRRSVKSGRLRLVSGSLGDDVAPIKVYKSSSSVSLGNFIPEKQTKKNNNETEKTDKILETKNQSTIKQNKNEDKKVESKSSSIVDEKKINNNDTVSTTKRATKNNTTKQESK